MKKIFLQTFLLMGCVLLTGCSTKTLKCNITTESSSTFRLVENLDLTFSGNKVTKMEISDEIHISGNYVNYIEELEESLHQKYEELENKKGVNIVTKNTEDVISVNINADLKKMDKETKEAFNIFNTKQSLSETKKELEEKGYTCK